MGPILVIGLLFCLVMGIWLSRILDRLPDVAEVAKEIDQALTRRKQKKAAKKALKLNLMGHKVKVCPDCRGLGDSTDGVCKTCGGAGMVQS